MPAAKQLPKEELDQRVAVLKRFRELLVRQRDKFRQYINVLDKQRSDIEQGDVDALVAHVETEQSMVADIFAVQKVLDPLEDMYRAVYHEAEPEGINELKNTLDELKTEVVKRNTENQALLKQRMDMLRHQIMNINNPYAKKRSVYAENPEPRSLDIKS
ncbi:MAG: flagellar protein FlgN [Spirochaetes bacterium]|nr:flagellar protein FlgN [Spirochaetota bacterium]MBU0954428.1 flagellar protein FlgN [Spirochaetota bacterium]